MRLVIKVAGALLESDSVVRELAAQVAALAKQGHEILVVHGGGRIFTATLKRLGIESKFVSGLRVTDRETRDVAVMVFAGLLNKQLSAAISAAGQPAMGVSAADAQAFHAEPLVHNECAEYLGADQLIYLTDVAGVLHGEKVISAIASDEIESLVQNRTVSGGMILKLEASKRALEGGVKGVHIVGGTEPGALLAAMRTAESSSATFDTIPGTRILREANSAAFSAA